ncbi:mannose-1-phosphate guanylyltransferase/mannose-6-phosphate isomerase [Pseudoalteromonas sp.]|uniref:mannose-1-phosphate guanylyltransferase/mannose-6-phosphate isomerase n=1 Tax=Pseudoalteromonas sp. TaxID=53249 RepID=UPI0026390794|nr:mannose-1-phosphate guanylyltransferase/mannose-6-phosphate isomerase [Pseudoalteromonas sp.]MCP4588750.1 mannose-1-phosphate guanylyltransferase/mannose-6-phosphate isomerase [Pseudoalteromonas sp.]
MIVPVILCGGSGSRLWPQSRQAYPKQFLPLTSEKTMFQETLLRLDGFEHFNPLIICNKDHRFIVSEQLRLLDREVDAIVLEPFSRNTAPAVALAAKKALDLHDDPTLLVLAADHLIADLNAFNNAVKEAAELADKGRLVTFGITPTKPETGYGYIKCGAHESASSYKIDSFKEKPDLETAKQYLSSGNYYWNSGMFMFKASSLYNELYEHAPDIASACNEAYSNSNSDNSFIWVEKSSFALCPDESIDNAVMEKTSEGAIIPMDAGWNDVGAWDALWEALDKDNDGNVLKGEVITFDTTDSYISSEKNLIATAGLKDIIVVESDDSILVAHKDSAQQVKSIVKQLDKQGGTKHKVHRKVFRPWGHYDSIDAGKRFHVKRICVKPGQKLSLQMHYHRAEHWIVVKGTARITRDEAVELLTENQSTYIPVGVLHRLENPGKVDLEIIEVQSGSYLDEDDIVRFDDNYGRAT